MPSSFQLEVVTPEKIVLSEEIQGLVVPAHEGYLGVLAGHAPLLCTLQPGEILLRSEKGDRFFATAGGFMEVSPEKTILLSESIEAYDEIDVARAEKARDRAKERLSDPQEGLDRDRVRGAMVRAMNRLKVAKKHAR